MFFSNRDFRDLHISTMNSSSYGFNSSRRLSFRDSYSTAVAKNVIVVALGLIINYINGTLIHTFRKHQVRVFCVITTTIIIVNIICQLSVIIISSIMTSNVLFLNLWKCIMICHVALLFLSAV